jgi:hypothetical protein
MTSARHGIVSSIDQGSKIMVHKPGPKEAQIRDLREERIEMMRRSAQNQKLLRGKAKVKAVSASVVRIKAVKRP